MKNQTIVIDGVRIGAIQKGFQPNRYQQGQRGTSDFENILRHRLKALKSTKDSFFLSCPKREQEKIRARVYMIARKEGKFLITRTVNNKQSKGLRVWLNSKKTKDSSAV